MLKRLTENKEQELGEGFEERCASLGLTISLIDEAKNGNTNGIESALATLLNISEEELIEIIVHDRAPNQNPSNGVQP